MDEVLDKLRSFIAYRVREGFESEQEIIENATSYAEENWGRDDLQPAIDSMTREQLSVHRTGQASWESPTDCDRLDVAFLALNRSGVVARQDFSCCTNCGHRDIWDEIEREEQEHSVEGYVFYHLQCTERAMDTGQLFLAYGSVEDTEQALTRVANKIVEEMRRVGLTAKWDGETGHAIVVEGLAWRRRR